MNVSHFRVNSQGSIKVEFHVITKDLKRLGYETNPRGPTAEIQNQGPSEGIGLVQKLGPKKGSRKKDKNGEQEDPGAIQPAMASTIEEGYQGSRIEECWGRNQFEEGIMAGDNSLLS